MDETSFAWKVTKTLAWLAIRLFPITVLVLGIAGGETGLITVGILLAIGIYGWQAYRFIRAKRAARIQPHVAGPGQPRGGR